MGALDLSDFRGELDLIFGDRSITNEETIFNRWINFGYLEITGALDFEELEEHDDTITTSASDDEYGAPTDALAIKLIKDLTNDQTLEWVSKPDLFRRPVGGEGEPLYWTRHKGDIYLRPTPDGAYNLRIFYKKSPTLLSGNGDQTVLQDMWDQAIVYFSASHGFMMLGEEQRGVAWYNRGVRYSQSRMTEQKFQEGTIGLKMAQADRDLGVDDGGVSNVQSVQG